MIDKSKIHETKGLILQKINEANKLIPHKEMHNLPPFDPKKFPNVPDWYDFEHQIWKIGEEIRQILVNFSNLRKDKELQRLIADVATNRNAKRGRQSFIMLLEYKFCSEYAPYLIRQLDDPGVDGHIISTVLKMRAAGFAKNIKPFTTHKITWIKNYAIKYCKKYP